MLLFLDVPSVESFSIVQSMQIGSEAGGGDGLYKDNGFPRLICISQYCLSFIPLFLRMEDTVMIYLVIFE